MSVELQAVAAPQVATIAMARSALSASSESAQGPGRVKTLRRLIVIEQIIRLGPFLSGHTANPLKFSLEPENIILAGLRAFEFSHDLGQ